MRIKKVKVKDQRHTYIDPLVCTEVPEEIKVAFIKSGIHVSGATQKLFDMVKSGSSKKEVADFLKEKYHQSGMGSPIDKEKDLMYHGYNAFKSGLTVEWWTKAEGYCEKTCKYSEIAEWYIEYKNKIRAEKHKSRKIKKRVKSKRKVKKRRIKPVVKEESVGEPSLVIVDEENEMGYTGEFHNVLREDGEEVLFFWKPEKKKMDVIDNEADLKLLCEKMMDIPAFAYDTETNTLDACADSSRFRCADITISWGENNNYDILVGKAREEDVDRNIDLDILVKYLKPVFEREDVLIIGQNLKFDLHVMNRLGIHVRTKYLFDTMLASWLCDENKPNGLKENSNLMMGVAQVKFKETTDSIPKEIKKAFGYATNAKVNDFTLVSVEDGKEYCTDDSFYTWCLYWGFADLLKHEGMDKIYYKKMIPFMLVLLEMEERGICVDREKLEQMQSDMEEDLDRLQYEIYELAGVEFNIGSPQQKCELLYGTVKEDKPVLKDKISKTLQALIDKYKDGVYDREEFEQRLDKQGIYVDDKGKMWRKQNVNWNLVNASFNFPVLFVTATGAPSTDKNTLLQLSHQEYKSKRKKDGVELCRKMLEYSKLEKLKGTFADGILEKIDIYDDGRCHPNFRQIGTDSGRISCANPNLQQLPKADEEDKYQMRSIFIGSEYYKALHTGNLYDTYEQMKEMEDAKVLKDFGYEKKRKKILAIDYHNLEMVCLTHFSHDRNLSEMFANDDDAHGSTAVNMFSLPCTPVECKKKYPHLRQAAKTINFMLMYGGGAQALYDALRFDPYSPVDLGKKEYLQEYGVRTGKDVAQCFIDRYFESYSGVAKFIREQKRYAHKHEYVWTIMGRKRRLPEINSRDGEKSSKSERLSVNACIQGTAGDITSSAQCRLVKQMELYDKLTYMLLQVHDELVYELPEEYAEEVVPVVKYYMEHPFGDKPTQQVDYLRADYDIGDNYQEAK